MRRHGHLVPQLLHVDGPQRHLPRGPLRPTRGTGPRGSAGPSSAALAAIAQQSRLRPHRLVGPRLERIRHSLLPVARGGADGRVDRVPAVRRGAGGTGLHRPSGGMSCTDWSVSYSTDCSMALTRQGSGAGWAICVSDAVRDPEGSLCVRQTYPD